MIWIETITNPLLKVVDIKGVKRVVEQRGQKPLDLGVDIVLHSITKYINGHSDVLMGSLVLNDDKLHEKLRYDQNAIGAVPSPFECFLVLRGIKTLALRMEQHQKSALDIVTHFKDHPKIKQVLYPLLSSHPQHSLFLSQCSGASGMITMKLKGDMDTAAKFMENLKIFSIAESLGGFESLVEHPATMTHSSVPAEERKKLGIGKTLIRFSVGLENTVDLIQDIEDALAQV